jgi:hypothetical protein
VSATRLTWFVGLIVVVTGQADAQRAAVLGQVKVPHPYYFR